MHDIPTNVQPKPVEVGLADAQPTPKPNKIEDEHPKRKGALPAKFKDFSFH